MLLQPPAVVLLATELLYSSVVVVAHFLRKIPFSGNLFCFLHTKLLPTILCPGADTFPMSITSRVSLDEVHVPHFARLLI